jgi:2-polyprenyl-3-methyl-5-hydroxy-6-metoxy-1,4-benzoquinol methylase
MTNAMAVHNRLVEEAEFADGEYAPMIGNVRISERMIAKYRHPRQMWDWRQRAARLLGNLEGKAILDYGCGQGEEAAYFAALGGRVTAIDISEVGIRVGRERAIANGLDIDFRVMSCTPTAIPSESFDLVHGLGILHHVGLQDGLVEAHRLLKPGGRAVFLEPLGSSGAVEMAKSAIHGILGHRLGLIPVTSGEENLRLKDIRRAISTWSDHEVYVYRLSYRARKLFLPKLFWNWSLRFDHCLLTACPPLARFAGGAVISLKK